MIIWPTYILSIVWWCDGGADMNWQNRQSVMYTPHHTTATGLQCISLKLELHFTIRWIFLSKPTWKVDYVHKCNLQCSTKVLAMDGQIYTQLWFLQCASIMIQLWLQHNILQCIHEIVFSIQFLVKIMRSFDKLICRPVIYNFSLIEDSWALWFVCLIVIKHHTLCLVCAGWCKHLVKENTNTSNFSVCFWWNIRNVQRTSPLYEFIVSGSCDARVPVWCSRHHWSCDTSFLAVHDSSIRDLVCLSLGWALLTISI